MAEQLSLSQLKAILGEQGIDMTGNKANFVARLAELDADGSIVRDWLSRHNDETAAQKEMCEELEKKMSKLNFRSRRIARYRSRSPMAKSIIAKMRLMDQKEKNKMGSEMLRDELNLNIWEKKKKINASSWNRLKSS